MSKPNAEDKRKIDEMRNAWKKRLRLSTQPKWKDLQAKSVEEIKMNLPEVDDETKEWILKEILLTLRCHYCERARSKSCNFSVCVRGLMSGMNWENNVGDK